MLIVTDICIYFVDTHRYRHKDKMIDNDSEKDTYAQKE